MQTIGVKNFGNVLKVREYRYNRVKESRSYDLTFWLFLATKVTLLAFDGSENHCKELYSVLQHSDSHLFTQTKALDNAILSDSTKSGFKPLPGRLECCGKKW